VRVGLPLGKCAIAYGDSGELLIPVPPSLTSWADGFDITCIQRQCRSRVNVPSPTATRERCCFPVPPTLTSWAYGFDVTCIQRQCRSRATGVQKLSPVTSSLRPLPLSLIFGISGLHRFHPQDLKNQKVRGKIPEISGLRAEIVCSSQRLIFARITDELLIVHPVRECQRADAAAPPRRSCRGENLLPYFQDSNWAGPIFIF